MVNEWAANVEKPFNLLPNFGISVLVLPLPGREGWGPQFATALADSRNFGTIDIDEGAEVVRQMIARGYTSSDRVGITGCSYGGYFATQSIARHPDLYAAANPQCTLLDTIVEWQTGFTVLMSYLMGLPPTTIPAEYVQDSPGYNTGTIRTPTLIFHGTEDYLPVSIAESFYKELTSQETPVRMLKFEEEGHGLAAPDNQLLAAQEQIAWFRQHLAGTPAPPPAADTPQAEPPAAATPQPEAPEDDEAPEETTQPVIPTDVPTDGPLPVPPDARPVVPSEQIEDAVRSFFGIGRHTSPDG
jgi:pimeloyl-ACP methyl ester carboxylesterase